jgi:hypothetical protein
MPQPEKLKKSGVCKRLMPSAGLPYFVAKYLLRYNPVKKVGKGRLNVNVVSMSKMEVERGREDGWLGKMIQIGTSGWRRRILKMEPTHQIDSRERRATLLL